MAVLDKYNFCYILFFPRFNIISKITIGKQSNIQKREKNKGINCSFQYFFVYLSVCKNNDLLRISLLLLYYQKSNSVHKQNYLI